MTTLHIPVLVQEAIQFVVKKPTGIFVDCTLGTGGHTQALSKVLNPDAYIIGIDADPALSTIVRKISPLRSPISLSMPILPI
jgi:16S rRNA C1402 N4-methylase RsmH